MSTVQRILFTAFGRSRRQHPAPHHALDQNSSAHQFGNPGELTSAPWEGLYFEGGNQA